MKLNSSFLFELFFTRLMVKTVIQNEKENNFIGFYYNIIGA